MRKKDIILSGIMSVIIAVFMAAVPEFIIKSRVPLTQQRSPHYDEDYQGIIRVWHIAGFRPRRGSLGGWLANRARSMEKLHYGVYFEVESISPEECEAKRARGEKADVYSFPAGWAYPEELRALTEFELPPLRGNLMGVGIYREHLYAVPYCASGYVVAANMRLMQEKGLAKKELPPLIRSGEIAAAGSGLMACIYGAKGFAAEDDFVGERACVSFMDARAAADLERKLQKGSGFPYEILPCCNFSDLVQFLGVDRGVDESKMGCIMEFIDTVYGKEEQSELRALGLLPAEYSSPIEKGDDMDEILWKSMDDIAAPNTFLYKTYSEEMVKSAAAALSGSEKGRKDFNLRVRELVKGAVIK